MKKFNRETEFEEGEHFSKYPALQGIGVFLIIIIIVGGIGSLFSFSARPKQNMNSNNLNIEYEKILRTKKETPIKIAVYSNTSESTIEIAISNYYFDKMSLKTIAPEPLKTTISENFYTMVFPVDKSGMHSITLNTIPTKPGNVQAIISSGSETISINQYIYP